MNLDFISLNAMMDIPVESKRSDMNLTPEHKTVLKGLHAKGGTGNVNEFLSIVVSDFDHGFTIANDMQNLDLVKLLYSNFNKNLVVVEWTLLGESEFNKPG